MAERILIEVLNMSLTASVVIAAVLVFRLVLRRAPRIFSYALWAVVLFRLLCPFSFSSHLSLLGVLQSEPASQGRMEYIPKDIGYQPEPEVSLPVPAANEIVNGSLPAGNPAGSVNPMQILLYVGSRLWMLGMFCMALYSIFSWVKLKKRLKNAVLERDNIYRLPGEGTPFVCGIFRPAIYFPGTYEEEEKEYLLLHEQIHIRRGDLIFRMLAWLALCLHWFNPFVWLAFSLSGRDMEMSCDEAVIRRLGNQVKKEYSRSLLAIASGQKIGRGIPIAFGEGETGGRIKNVLGYRKPAAFLVGFAAVLCVVLAGFFLANPQGRNENSNVFYGVVQYEDAEGADLPLIVYVPRIGEVEIPEAEEIGPYIETDFDGLEAGDLVRITFPPKEEISVMETYPARFSEKAESIEVMGRGPFWIRPNGPGRYLFTVPLGMAFDAKKEDLLEIYHHGPETDGQEKELLAAVKVQSVYKDAYQIWVELSTEELETFLAEFGFGVECRLVKAEENRMEPAMLEESGESTAIWWMARWKGNCPS